MLSDADRRDRSLGPTASTIAGILGLHPFMTPLTVWQEARGEHVDKGDPEAMRMGHKLEPICRSEYEEQTGRTITQPERYRRRVDDMDVTATADGVTFDGVDARGVECKSHRVYAAGDYGQPGTDEVPAHEWIQCQVGMALANLPAWDLVPIIDGRVRIYSINRDSARASSMIETACRWWRDHVIAERMPAPSGRSIDNAAIAAIWPGTWRAKPELLAAGRVEVELIENLKTARRARKTAEILESTLEQKLKLAIGDADGLIVGNGPDKVTWRKATDGRKVDYQAALVDYQNHVQLALSRAMQLAAGANAEAQARLASVLDIPKAAALAAFTTITPGSRRFLVPRTWTAELTPDKDDQ